MRFRKFPIIIVLASLSFVAAGSSRATDLSNAIAGSVSDGTTSIPYQLLQPTGLAAGQKVPLILYLHGMGDRGTDNVAQTTWIGNLQQKTASGQYAAYVLAPQIASDMWFSTKNNAPSEAEILTMDAVKKAMQNPNIDTSRIYVTGTSMGGQGTWDILRRAPGLFAAAVPMSGGFDPSIAPSIKDVPIWAFHGAVDSVVPVQDTRDMVSALKAVGGNIKYTEVAGGDHEIWPQVYADAGNTLYSWLFSQQNLNAGLATVNSPSDLGAGDPVGLSVSSNAGVFSSSSAASIAASAAAVPEPASIGLLALGGMALLRRRNRAN
jgi:predicted esterase